MSYQTESQILNVFISNINIITNNDATNMLAPIIFLSVILNIVICRIKKLTITDSIKQIIIIQMKNILPEMFNDYNFTYLTEPINHNKPIIKYIRLYLNILKSIFKLYYEFDPETNCETIIYEIFGDIDKLLKNDHINHIFKHFEIRRFLDFMINIFDDEYSHNIINDYRLLLIK